MKNELPPIIDLKSLRVCKACGTQKLMSEFIKIYENCYPCRIAYVKNNIRQVGLTKGLDEKEDYRFATKRESA